MNDGRVLNDVMVSAPCPMDWDGMAGGDRVRYCTACGKHVHDFAKMTSAEASALLEDNDWNVCGRLSQRADGTIVTADHSVTAESSRTPWQFNIRSLMGVIGSFAATLGIGRLLADYMSDRSNTPPPKAPLTTILTGKMVPAHRFSSTAPSVTSAPGAQPGCPVP
jgi:hypothetical protein